MYRCGRVIARCATSPTRGCRTNSATSLRRRSTATSADAMKMRPGPASNGCGSDTGRWRRRSNAVWQAGEGDCAGRRPCHATDTALKSGCPHQLGLFVLLMDTFRPPLRRGLFCRRTELRHRQSRPRRRYIAEAAGALFTYDLRGAALGRSDCFQRMAWAWVSVVRSLACRGPP